MQEIRQNLRTKLELLSETLQPLHEAQKKLESNSLTDGTFSNTKIVLLNLLICVVVFYIVYYVVLSICFAAFRLEMLDGWAPFDFKTNPSWINPNYLVLLVSLEITYFICGLLFALIVEEWVWDYAITVTAIHIIITAAVMSEFPLMLHWWMALGSGLILMICGGQVLAYCLFKDNFIHPVLDDF
ncbi:putative transmembrane protein 244 [Lepidochelys kempii]|uniref:putative transmembrane protein 244 n=1 Tax=Lepidochelys kempii TaxID=8472 RepID=UPI0020952293|nr:transmembrane protein 244 [Caretta caretta]